MYLSTISVLLWYMEPKLKSLTVRNNLDLDQLFFVTEID